MMESEPDQAVRPLLLRKDKMKKIQVLGSLVLPILAVGALLAQAPKSAPAFEVAAIRVASLPTPDTFRSGQFRLGMQLDGGSLDWGFVSLADLLPYAFRVKTFQISGPAWMPASRWNIQAKLPQGASQDQVPEMMEALLADRFKLTFHREKREQPVYELVVAKGGPKLEPSTVKDEPGNGDASTANTPGFFPGPLGGLMRGGPGRGDQSQGQDGRGGRGAILAGGPNGPIQISAGDGCGIHMDLAKLSLQELADTLSPFLDRPVVDSTGLKGNYKVSLDLPLEVMFAMMQNTIRTAGLPMPGPGGFGGPGGGGPEGRGPGDGPPGGRGLPGCPDPAAALGDASGSSNAPIFQAVQKLGLKLEAHKAPFDTIVVDHLEKEPSEN